MIPLVLQVGSPSQVAGRKYSERLEDYCRQHGLDAPQYERTMVTMKDRFYRDMPFYNFRVTITALVNTYGSFQWPKLWPTESEAREAAAQFVLLQLGVGA